MGKGISSEMRRGVEERAVFLERRNKVLALHMNDEHRFHTDEDITINLNHQPRSSQYLLLLE